MNSETRPNNRILFYTMLSLIAIAIYVIINSYYTQINIFQEKELFKLDCIADAVSFKIDGDQHDALFDKYPENKHVAELKNDPSYREIQMMLAMTSQMKMANISTLVYDSTTNKMICAIDSDNKSDWKKEKVNYPNVIVQKYTEGGAVPDPYKHNDETWLTAFSPIYASNGDVAAILQVDERFDSFLAHAQEQIFFNLGISLIFILVLGVLMFYSVKSILQKQENVRLEKIQVENLRKELLANVSHDLRTPLASIHGYLETIQMKRDSLSPERLDKYLDTTLRNTEKLKKLVDELFDLSLLESKEKKLNLEPININDLCHDVLNDFRLKALEKNIKLSPNLAKDLLPIKGDTSLIERVLQNIIGNSVKNCVKHDSITISTIRQGDLVKLTIADTGAGISEEDLKYIFNRFSMGKSGETGTGLGLAIVKNILDLHGYEYDLKSSKGEGTIFSCYLELCPEGLEREKVN